jgi:hypothetical protein
MLQQNTPKKSLCKMPINTTFELDAPLLSLKTLLFSIFMMLSSQVWAQNARYMCISLPDKEIFATQLQKGDADTYGLGDWEITVQAALEGTAIRLTGNIIFTEKANDNTTITGRFNYLIPVPALESCQFCQIELLQKKGNVSGPNIGARGAQWFAGTGIVKRASITTDTFGNDVGRIGGTLQFGALTVRVKCPLAK